VKRYAALLFLPLLASALAIVDMPVSAQTSRAWRAAEVTPTPQAQIIYQGTMVMDEDWINVHRDDPNPTKRLLVPLPGAGYLVNWPWERARLDDPLGWCGGREPTLDVWIEDPAGEIKNFWEWTSGGTAFFQFGLCLSSNFDPYPYKADLVVYWEPDADADKVPDHKDQCPSLPQPDADDESSGCPPELPATAEACQVEIFLTEDEIEAGEMTFLHVVAADENGPVQGGTARVVILDGPGAVDGPYPTDENGEAIFTYEAPETLEGPAWVELQGTVEGCPGEAVSVSLFLLPEGASPTIPAPTPSPTPSGPAGLRVSVLDRNAQGQAYLGVASDGVSTLALVAEVSGPLRADQVQWELELLDPGKRAGWIYEDARADATRSVVTFKPPSAFEKPFRVRVTASVRAPSGQVLQDSVEIHVVRPPVILGHGIWASRGSMMPINAFLLTTRQFELVRTVDYGLSPRKSYADMRTSAQYVAQGVESALAKFDSMGFKASRVDIVAHSMGGLLSRLYIVGDGGSLPAHPDKVRKLVTLATPHGGSSVADWYTDFMDNRFVRCQGDKARFVAERVTENEVEWFLGYVRREVGLKPDALTFGPAVRQMQTVDKEQSIVRILLARKAFGAQTEYHVIAGNRPLIGGVKEFLASNAIFLSYPYTLGQEVLDPNSQIPYGVAQKPPGPCGETWRAAVNEMVSQFVELVGEDGTDGVVAQSSGLGLGTGIFPRDRLTLPLDHFAVTRSNG
jgi:pimeloyl-ACP methyl ester carboxylesterase